MKFPPPLASALQSGMGAIVKWLIGSGLVVGLIISVAQCSIEKQNAREASVQTYNMGRVAAFRDSGAELDKKVAAFNDAAAEGRSLTDARHNVRDAMADHAVKTFAMEDAFGETATDQYSSALKALQAAVEETKDATNSGTIITALSRVVVTRKKLADEVTKNATA